MPPKPTEGEATPLDEPTPEVVAEEDEEQPLLGADEDEPPVASAPALSSERPAEFKIIMRVNILCFILCLGVSLLHKNIKERKPPYRITSVYAEMALTGKRDSRKLLLVPGTESLLMIHTAN